MFKDIKLWRSITIRNVQITTEVEHWKEQHRDSTNHSNTFRGYFCESQIDNRTGLGIYKRKKENTHDNKKIVYECVFACVFSCPSSFLRGRFLVRVRVFVRVCQDFCMAIYSAIFKFQR